MDINENWSLILSGISAGVLCLIFARAMVHKLLNRYEFVGIITDYRILPASLVTIAATLLPVVELLITVSLLIPSTRQPGAIAAVALLLFYGAMIAINLLRGRTSIDCGCGGSGHGISWLHVLRNIIYSGIGLVAIFAPAGGVSGINTAFVVVLCVLLLWLLVLLFEQVLNTRSHIITTYY